MWVGGRAFVRYVITEFSRLDSLPNFLTHGGPLRALCARESSAININKLNKQHINLTELNELELFCFVTKVDVIKNTQICILLVINQKYYINNWKWCQARPLGGQRLKKRYLRWLGILAGQQSVF